MSGGHSEFLYDIYVVMDCILHMFIHVLVCLHTFYVCAYICLCVQAVYQQVYKAPPDSTNYSMDTSYGSTASGHHSGRSSNYTGSSEVANLGLYSSHHHTHGSSHEDHEHEPDDDALLKTYSGVNTSSTNKK
jgi:hypothetical protein